LIERRESKLVQEAGLKRVVSGLFVGAMVTLSSSAFGAEAVRIGVITDMSGPYSDLVGPGFVTAVKMATIGTMFRFCLRVLTPPLRLPCRDLVSKERKSLSCFPVRAL
jgi:hypothetical protein